MLCTLIKWYVVPAWGPAGRRRAGRPSLSYPRPPQRSSDKVTPPKMSHVTELHGGRNLSEMRYKFDQVHLLYCTLISNPLPPPRASNPQ